jgi:predicted ATPase
VGRQYEVEVLSRHFAAAICGQTQVVLVAGEPGIGKTRLLEHAAEQVAERGATVLRGGASEAEGIPPYLPLLEARPAA